MRFPIQPIFLAGFVLLAGCGGQVIDTSAKRVVPPSIEPAGIPVVVDTHQGADRGKLAGLSTREVTVAVEGDVTCVRAGSTVLVWPPGNDRSACFRR